MECLEVHPDELSKALDREVSEVLDLHLVGPSLETADADPVLQIVAELVRHPNTKPPHCAGIQLVVVQLKSLIKQISRKQYLLVLINSIPDHFDCFTKLDHKI